jgi:hypothetical protein
VLLLKHLDDRLLCPLFRCPQYSSEAELHQKEMEKALAEAKEKYKVEHPEASGVQLKQDLQTILPKLPPKPKGEPTVLKQHTILSKSKGKYMNMQCASLRFLCSLKVSEHVCSTHYSHEFCLT